jgi:4-amino-4-deoxy-L-arabinose transferase-like glycosyltransferase
MERGLPGSRECGRSQRRLVLRLADPKRRRLVAGTLIVGVFALALGARLAYRTDTAGVFDELMPAQSFISHRRAVRMLEGDGLLIWEDLDPAILRQIRRPPGYSIFLAAVYVLTGPDLRSAQIAQAVFDSLAAALVAAFGMVAISWRAGAVAGVLYALSPHLALYATIVTPDAPASWPISVGVILLFAALRGGGGSAMAAALASGFALGLSCWLTAQGVLLPFVLAGVSVLITPRDRRKHAARCGVLVILGGVAAVAPLTIRNIALYGSFTPVRPGLGTTLVEGLGVYDPAFPATDRALLADEAARFGRPDYGEALYQPDGALRERDRVGRALAAIAARPLWFAGVMLDRMGLMLSYDHSGVRPWPESTGVVAPVNPRAGSPFETVVRVPIWSLQVLLFRTWSVRLLILLGLAWLVARGRWRLALFVGAVPAHHLLLGSLLLTEYKYALPIHPWLFLFAGAGIGEAIFAFVARRGEREEGGGNVEPRHDL